MIQSAARPQGRPHTLTATTQITRRNLRKYFRTPGLSVMGVVQSGAFLLAFRFVFGGAVRAGTGSYVDYLVPGFVATVVLFSGSAIAVAVAEDRSQGFTDRLLSLPIPRVAIVVGRVFSDSLTNAWSLVTTAAIGFAIGFRLRGSLVDGLAAFGLCLLYGIVFTVVFIVIGLLAASPAVAQGISTIGFVVVFVSSTYVPVSTMPSWLQPFAGNQPISPMVNAVRSLLVGGSHDLLLALVWSVVLVGVLTPIAVLRYRRS